jgi:outer membrane cobalamin receptor
MASVWSPVNIYKTSTNGIETNFEFVNKFIQLNLNYVFQHPKNITKGSEFFNKILIYSPREIWNIFVSFKIEMLAFNISHKHISHRFYTEDNDTRYFLPSYNIFDFSISFESRIFELNTRLKFEVNNIFNKNYQVIAGYPLPGREYRIQLNIDLNRKE